jgi:hypothetical protein
MLGHGDSSRPAHLIFQPRISIEAGACDQPINFDLDSVETASIQFCVISNTCHAGRLEQTHARSDPTEC